MISIARPLALSAVLAASLGLQGCIVGTAVGVAGAVVGTGIKATGAVVGAGVDAVTTSDAETLRKERRACERRNRRDRDRNEDCGRFEPRD